METISKINIKGIDYQIKDETINLEFSKKQDVLISGVNIKTINGESLLGSDDINIIPTIGENNNWYINGEDTGKPSKGLDGVNLGDVLLVQNIGDDENSVMSQKAINNSLNEIKSIVNKTITYDVNSFKINNVGVLFWNNPNLTTYGADCSSTYLIIAEGCTKIHLKSKISNNAKFKPFAFYDANGLVIIPDYYENNFSGEIDVDIIPPNNVKYVEFRSQTSYNDFKAEIFFKNDNEINLIKKIEEQNDYINFINEDLNEKEIYVNADKSMSEVKTSGSITYIPLEKGILKDINIPLNRNDVNVTLTLLQNISNNNEIILTPYKTVLIQEDEILSNEDNSYYINKILNLEIKNKTYLYITSTIPYCFNTTKNYDKDLCYLIKDIYGCNFSIKTSTRPIFYTATISSKEGFSDLTNSINVTKENVDDINVSIQQINENLTKLEEKTNNVANINDVTPSNIETYSSYKIEERISEIQNASANVQIVNSEGNSTTNGISQAAATLSLSKRIKVFKNVEEMKSDTTLKEDMSCQTLGYYDLEDGGHGFYVIKSGEMTENKGSIIALNNGLFAVLIFDGVINIKQWGWNKDFTTVLYGVIPYDITDTLNRILNYIRTNKQQGRTSTSIIYFPKGVYFIGESISLGSNIILEGQSGSAYAPDKTNSSVIITNFPGKVFLGNRFYLRKLTFLGVYKSTSSENDTFVAESPKEISYCTIGGYDYVCEGLVSVGEISHCVAWLMGKGIVKSKVNDSFIHHNLLTGSCWNKNQNCETTAIVLGGCAASCISDNYIDFWTYGIRGSVQMVNMMIANNTIDYCGVGIHVEGCEGCIIQGNNFYHINKSTTNGSGVVTSYPEDSTWRTTPWCCINIGSTTKSLSVIGNIAQGSDVFMKGNKATELYAYGNMVRGCGSKYSEQNLQSDVCFIDNKDVEI